MTRVAILHYTLSPAVGGIETLIDAQCAALRRSGHDVRLIAGAGRSRHETDPWLIARMLPTHPEAQAARRALAAGDRHATRTLVRILREELRAALMGCDACWVHNAFTVALHPALTCALEHLATALHGLQWVAWCEDLSVESAYWDGPSPRPAGIPGMRYVTISPARATQVTSLLGLAEDAVQVISPPVDVFTWLDLAPETSAIVRRTGLLNAYPSVLVPAKLLPHKRIDRAIAATAGLRARGHRPRLLVSAAASPHQPDLSAALVERLGSLATELGVAHSVHLLGPELGRPPGDRTIRDLMLLCDLVFLPSAEEGFGVPAREAAALRAPIVCSDIPAFRAAAPGARFVPPAASVDAMADALLEVAASPANLARREAAQSWERFQRQIDDLARCSRS